MERYSSYKDSGISWIGEIPEHWGVRHLSQVSYEHYISNKEVHHQNLLSLSYGRIIRKDINTTEGLLPASFDTYQIVEEGNIVMRLTDLQNDHKSLRVGLVKEEGIVTSAYVCLGVYDSIFPSYLYNVLHSYDIKKLFYSMGGGLRQNLNWQGLKKLDIPLPPKDEQQAIVAYIEEKCQMIDAYVADKEKEIVLLQELKQKTIADAVTKGLNPDTKMKDSGISWIGEIPGHWEVKRIASLFTGKVQANTDFKYHHAFKFYYGTLVPKNEVGDNEEYRDTYVKYSVLQKDDIMINGLNLNYDFVSQRVAIAPSDGIITSAYVVARPRKGTNAQYYNYLFKTMDNMKLFHGMGTGIRLTLSFDEMKKQVVVVPPLDEQQAIVTYIEEKCEKIDKLASELQSGIDYLKEYKQRLIADCVTGQVKV